MDMQQLSDKGLSIFVFAAYQQLTSGEAVLAVSLHDGAGHSADPQGVREVESLGLARVESDRAILSDAGLALLEQLLQMLRSVAAKAESGKAIA